MLAPLAPTLRGLIALGLLATLWSCDNAPDGPDAPHPRQPAGSKAAPITELHVARVDADLSKPDPKAPFWGKVAPGEVKLMAQPMIAPRPETTTTESIEVQAVHDGTHLAVRLRWSDTEQSEAGRLSEYSDAVAMQFPINTDPMPPVIMGAKGLPVHIFHWRAQYQRDAEEGKPEMATLYPNASIDMYAMDFRDAPGGSRAEQEMFNPGVALGNPQAFHKSGVDEIIAEGFATSAVQAGHGSAGVGVWEDGAWTVTLIRPLQIDGGSTLTPNTSSSVSFAAWQGGKGEVGSRKSILMSWLPVRLAP